MDNFWSDSVNSTFLLDQSFTQVQTNAILTLIRTVFLDQKRTQSLNLNDPGLVFYTDLSRNTVLIMVKIVFACTHVNSCSRRLWTKTASEPEQQNREPLVAK